MKITKIKGFTVKMICQDNPDIEYYVTDITIKIIHVAVYPSIFPQPRDTCEIFGDFSMVDLPINKRLNCTFTKEDYKLEGDCYYNNIKKTIELDGALTIEKNKKMKKGNKNKLALINLLSDNNVIVHAFEIENFMEEDMYGHISSEGYSTKTASGRSKITIQIEKVK